MKQVYELDKEDIKEIIAKHFDTDIKNVEIDCYLEWVGYGMNETQEPTFSVTVTQGYDNVGVKQ